MLPEGGGVCFHNAWQWQGISLPSATGEVNVCQHPGNQAVILYELLKQPWLSRSALCQYKHLCIHALSRIGKLVLLENSLHYILLSLSLSFLLNYYHCF